MGFTALRVRPKLVVAAAHQAAFGSAASSGGALVRQAALRGSAIRRGALYEDSQGTHGSEFPRDTRLEVATSPGARLRFYGSSRPLLALILEHATHGQPTATLAASDISETGETGGVLAAWTLTGVRPTFNTDSAGRIYAKLEDETPAAGQARVSLYSDSARTALIAQGSAADGVTATLAEQNSSGLSGTVALGTVAASNLTGIVLSVLRVRPQRAATVERYFTLFRDTGVELETLSDCTVERLRFESTEGGPLIVEAEIVASTYAIGATALTPSVGTGDREVFGHAAMTLTHNAIGQSVLSCSHGIEHVIERELANAAAAAAVWKRGSRLLPIEVVTRLADESRTIRNDGAAGTWREIVIGYAYSTKDLTFTYPRAVLAEAELPESGERDWEDHRLVFEARDDGTNAPVSIVLDV